MKQSPITCLFVIVFLSAVADLGMVYSTLPFLVKKMGGTAATYTWMFAIYTVMQTFGNMLRGVLADRFGRRPVLLLGHLGSAAAMTLLCFSPSIAWLFVARGLSGLMNGSQVTATTAAIDISAPGQSIKGISLLEGSCNLGWFVVGTLLGGALYLYNPLAPFVGAALISSFNFVYTFFFFAETRSTSGADKAALGREIVRKSRKSAFRDLLIRPNILVCMFLMGCTGIAVGVVQSCYALFLSARFDFNPFYISCLMSLQGLLIFGTQFFLVARLAKRFGEYRLFFGATILCALGAFIYGPALALFPNVLLLVVGIVLWSLGAGPLIPALTSIISREAPEHLKGTALGLQRSVLYLAKGFSPIGGVLFDRVGIAVPFVLTSSMFLLSSVLARWMSRRSIEFSIETRLAEPIRKAS